MHVPIYGFGLIIVFSLGHTRITESVTFLVWDIFMLFDIFGNIGVLSPDYENFQLPYINTVASVKASRPFSLLLIKVSPPAVIGEFADHVLNISINL